LGEYRVSWKGFGGTQTESNPEKSGIPPYLQELGMSRIQLKNKGEWAGKKLTKITQRG